VPSAKGSGTGRRVEKVTTLDKKNGGGENGGASGKFHLSRGKV